MQENAYLKCLKVHLTVFMQYLDCCIIIETQQGLYVVEDLRLEKIVFNQGINTTYCCFYANISEECNAILHWRSRCHSGLNSEGSFERHHTNTSI